MSKICVLTIKYCGRKKLINYEKGIQYSILKCERMSAMDIEKRKKKITSFSLTSNISSVVIERCMLLGDIIAFLTSDTYLSKYLALKGGTVINFGYLDVPRMSNDIDFDFCKNIDFQGIEKERQIMTEKLQKISTLINNIVAFNRIPKGSSCSFEYRYLNINGQEDSVFLDINFLKRIHIFEYDNIIVQNKFVNHVVVKSLNITEVMAGKIKILLERKQAKDFFDVFNIIMSGVIIDKALLRKCIIFYNVVSGKCDIDSINIASFDMDRISFDELVQMLTLPKTIDTSYMIVTVVKFLKEILIIEENEQCFIDDYRNHIYSPERLFDDYAIAEKIRSHPLALLI